MSRHPTDGVVGSKPRVPKADGNVSKTELSRLNREYLLARNAQMASKAAMSQMEADRARGELISLKLVRLQVAYALTIFRQKTLLAPAAAARRLVTLELVDPAKEHSVAEAIREDIYALLNDLADLPGQVSDPSWLSKIDDDLLDQAGGLPPERRQTPTEAKTAAAKAKLRREKRNTAQRRRRAEGRVKG